jgi:hypothetical protein
MLQANAQDTGPMMPLEQARQFLLHYDAGAIG